MKRVFIILIAILLGNSAHAFADITELNWQNANRFYQQKQYDSAVVYYEKIAVLQSSNSALYYNLGNAYYSAPIKSKWS